MYAAWYVMITLNFHNFVRVVTQTADLNAQPIFNAIVDAPLPARFIINPQSITISRQLSFDKFRIIYVVAFREYYEHPNIANDSVDILLKAVEREREVSEEREGKIRLRDAVAYSRPIKTS